MQNTTSKESANAQRIKAAALLQDIRMGLDDFQLMAKYKITVENLRMVRGKLAAGGRMRPEQTVPERQFLIRKRVTDETLFTGRASSLAALAEAAVRAGVGLENANLRGSRLAGANIHGIHLAGSDLSQCNLSNSDLGRSDLRGADLIVADLSGANLQSADLMGAIMMGANLTGAVLSRANLAGVDFTGADLTDADLSHCNLEGANLTDAKLQGAKTEGVSFSAAIKNKMAEEKEEKTAARKRFISSPPGLALFQLGWLLATPLGFAVLGKSLVWSLLMMISLVVLTFATAKEYQESSGWLILLFVFQVPIFLVMSILTGAMILPR